MARRKEKTELRKFGILLGVILGAITFYQWWAHERLWEELAAIGALLAMIGIVFPKGLKPVYRPWMWVAEKIGAVMNRVILTLFYVILFTPTALIRRLFNRDPLQLKWHKDAESYFEPKESQPVEQFKNIF